MNIHAQRPAADTTPVPDIHTAILQIMARGDRENIRTAAQKQLKATGRNW